MGEYAHAEGAAARWGHYAPELLSASILGSIALGFHPLPGVYAFAVPVALMSFVIASWLMMRKHDRRLCEQCMSSMPLNAAEYAAKMRRRFWMAHTGSQKKYLIPYLIILIGSNFVAAIGTPERVGWAFIQLSMIYLIMSQVTHRRLQPWCPWCSDGGGGSHQDEQTPDPVLPNDRVPA